MIIDSVRLTDFRSEAYAFAALGVGVGKIVAFLGTESVVVPIGTPVRRSSDERHIRESRSHHRHRGHGFDGVGHLESGGVGRGIIQRSTSSPTYWSRGGVPQGVLYPPAIPESLSRNKVTPRTISSLEKGF